MRPIFMLHLIKRKKRRTLIFFFYFFLPLAGHSVHNLLATESKAAR